MLFRSVPPASSPSLLGPAAGHEPEDSRRLPSDVGARRSADQRPANPRSGSSSRQAQALTRTARQSTTALSFDPPASVRKSPATYLVACTSTAAGVDSNRAGTSLAKPNRQAASISPQRFKPLSPETIKAKRANPTGAASMCQNGETLSQCNRINRNPSSPIRAVTNPK